MLPDYPRSARVYTDVGFSIRAGGSELHNISAITGGMMAQEIIKIITKQYVPIDNIGLFDGVGSKSGIFRL